MVLIHLVLLLILGQFSINSFRSNFFLSKSNQLSILSLRNNQDYNFEPPIRSNEWAKQRGLTPGYGGYWPGNPDAKKYKVTIISNKTGEEYVQYVPNDRYIYFYFEDQGVNLPIVNKERMCRQSCCTICAAKLVQGKVSMDAPLGLLKDFREKGYVLSCCAYPRAENTVIMLQDEDEMYIRQWSESFEGGGVEWGGFIPEED